MNITVQVDEISLTTAVGEIASEYDYESESVTKPGGPVTVAHLVAEMIVDRLTKSRDYRSMQEQVREIRAEVIREAIRPQVEEAIAKPIVKTNHFGEPVGEPTTLRELVIAEARKVITEPVDKYSRDRGTFLSQAVAAEVRQALSAEIADAVRMARQQVADEAGQQVAAAVMVGRTLPGDEPRIILRDFHAG